MGGKGGGCSWRGKGSTYETPAPRKVKFYGALTEKHTRRIRRDREREREREKDERQRKREGRGRKMRDYRGGVRQRGVRHSRSLSLMQSVW